MNVLSLFDGISCGRVALGRAEVGVSKYYSCEIKEDAIKVANHNYPEDTENRLGDVTKVIGADLPKIDLLIGGSPCQDFSRANRNRTGLEGSKSGLYYEYVRLLKETKPKYFFLENVRMSKEYQDIISNDLGVEPIVINSKSLVPQLRHRLYWTNIPMDSMPEETSSNLNDILECGYSDRSKARALLESDSRPLSTPIKMAHRYFNTGFTTLIFKDKEHFKEVDDHFKMNFKGLPAIEINNKIVNMDLSLYDGLRYMNSREREMCQGVPLGYTSVVSDNKAAGLLGDGWTVDVIAHILSGIKQQKEV